MKLDETSVNKVIFSVAENSGAREHSEFLARPVYSYITERPRHGSHEVWEIVLLAIRSHQK